MAGVASWSALDRIRPVLVREPLARLGGRQPAAEQRADDRVGDVLRRAGGDDPRGDGVGRVPSEEPHP